MCCAVRECVGRLVKQVTAESISLCAMTILMNQLGLDQLSGAGKAREIQGSKIVCLLGCQTVRSQIFKSLPGIHRVVSYISYGEVIT